MTELPALAACKGPLPSRDKQRASHPGRIHAARSPWALAGFPRKVVRLAAEARKCIKGTIAVIGLLEMPSH